MKLSISSIADLLAAYPQNANLLPDYTCKQVFMFEKLGDKRANPHYFSVDLVTCNGFCVYHAKHTHLAPISSQDVCRGETFDNYLDARAWLLEESLGYTENLHSR